MKALILNSGIGSRMGALTKESPKCMLRLYNGETILERQIRILNEYGIKDFVITTGYCREQIEKAVKKFDALNFEFSDNPHYRNTNYIVSMNNANKFLEDDIILIHGDLVFNRGIVNKILNDSRKSVCLYNEKSELPKKDFKGRFDNGLLREVSTDIFDKDCFAFQPMYKLCREDISLWLKKIKEYVSEGNVKVYAENALNEILSGLKIQGISYKDDYISEIDDIDDYTTVSEEIQKFDFREQDIHFTDDYISILKRYISKGERIFVVCGKHLRNKTEKDFSVLECQPTFFSEFTPNPKLDEVILGTELLKNKDCKKIISVGGGSTIDTAKAINLFYSAKNCEQALESKINQKSLFHIAVPTTAGSGSESTQFAVVYQDDKKLSIDSGAIFPDSAVLDYNFLKSLPEYQKKSALADVLCHAIESYWSKGADEESKSYSVKSIELVTKYYRSYLENDTSAMQKIFEASNYSGKAINISTTTAPHAMSYKLTSIYGIAHGHAAAVCLVPCWRLLLKKSHNDKILEKTLYELAKVLKQKDIAESVNFVESIILDLDFPKVIVRNEDIETLVSSVNAERLSNNPVLFNKEELRQIYRSVSGN